MSKHIIWFTKTLTLIFVATSIICSCRKDDNRKDVEPVGELTKFTIDSSLVKPGSLITLSASRPLIIDSITVKLGGKSLTLIKIDSFHYAFYTPVLSPGSYVLDLSKIKAANSPSVTVTNYTVIDNPDKVITEAVTGYNNLADGLLVNNYADSATTANVAFMHQAMEQIIENIKNSTAEEKIIIAYQMQEMIKNVSSILPAVTKQNTSFVKKNIIASNHPSGMISLGNAALSSKSRMITNNTTALAETDDDADKEFQDRLGAATYFNDVALISFLAFKTSFVLVLLSGGNSIAVIPCIIYGASAAYFKVKAKMLNMELSGFQGIAAVLTNGGFGSSSNPIAFSGAVAQLQKLSATFRTMIKDDKGGFNEDITKNIIENETLEQVDGDLKSGFENLKAKLSLLFSKITTNYVAYVSPVLSVAKQKVALISNKYVTVTNVSNPDIVLTATDDGANGLKITATNPKNNLQTTTPFTFQLSYTQTAIHNKVTITEQANYKTGNQLSLTTLAVSNITKSTALSGGNITNNGGETITAKGVCWSYLAKTNIQDSHTTDGTGNSNFTSNITGLKSNTTYYLRAYAVTSSKDTVYGNEISFTTLDPNTNLNNKIIGKWHYTKYTTDTNIKILNDPFEGTDYIDVRSDGTLYHHFTDGTVVSFTWSISGNTLAIKNADTDADMQIITLTDTNLTVTINGIDNYGAMHLVSFFFTKQP